MTKLAAPLRIFVGFDSDETDACAIAIESIRRSTSQRPDIRRLSRLTLWKHYTRPTERRNNRLWDVVSAAPMSTDHAIARFFVPFLCDYTGWALFVDGDVLCRRDIAELFSYAHERYAVMCVHHQTEHIEGVKKDGAAQLNYPRKNWSSVMLFNCGHPSNRTLDLEVLNYMPGRELHRFGWLNDEEIGKLPPWWNYLVGVEPRQENPALVHYTLGTPRLAPQAPYADEWFNLAAVLGYNYGVEVASLG